MTARQKPAPKQGTRGTPKTRRMQRYIADHIYDMTKDLTQAEAAEATGLAGTDIKNMRCGHMPSLRTLIDVIKKLRVTPDSLIAKGKLEPLAKGVRMNGAQLQLVCGRVQKICKEEDAASLAKKTGLPKTSIYQLRTQNARVGIHIYLAFVSAGYSPSTLLFG